MFMSFFLTIEIFNYGKHSRLTPVAKQKLNRADAFNSIDTRENCIFFGTPVLYPQRGMLPGSYLYDAFSGYTVHPWKKLKI